MKPTLFGNLLAAALLISGSAILSGCDAMAGKSDHPPAHMPPPEPYVQKQNVPIATGTATTPPTETNPPASTTSGTPLPSDPAATTTGGTSSGPAPTEPTAQQTVVLLGKWTGEPSFPEGGSAEVRNIMAAQSASIKKYGPIVLEIVDETNYKLALFGFKIEGRYEVTNNFLTLRPATIQGADLETASGKGVKGPDGKVAPVGDSLVGNMDFEIMSETKTLKYNQGKGTSELIFKKS